jgi:hypothetical protein
MLVFGALKKENSRKVINRTNELRRMKNWIRNHISDLNEELKLINKEVIRLIKKRSLLKRKINMFNKVMKNTNETE